MATIDCHQCNHPFDTEKEGPFCPRCGSRNDESSSTSQSSTSGGTPVQTQEGAQTEPRASYVYQEQETNLQEDAAANFMLFGCLGGLFFTFFDGLFHLFKKIFRLDK